MFRDITTLSTLTGLSADELCGEPTAFKEGDTWVVPARTAWAIAEKVAERVAGPIIEGVERDERELSSEQRHWKLLTPNREPDKQTEESWERRRESIRYRREWIGAENNSLRQQALNAESEAERLRGLVEWGISKLAGYGHKSSAETLRRNLGAESRVQSAESPQEVRKGTTRRSFTQHR
ncbi:hypothetical protein LRQ04_00140 [Paenarthrobacter sp. AR 02]|uniref:hypothetical protein n=1 Tax=Paenarthrobacter sp. AR 02 TaxID=2899821 RepID=UPI001F3503F3|nr:hypothetical protein [Paenarthrobacter sp. AR 02]MCF3137651.1 hypothetical protein [Paenarthrobacter sp. AR 02]